MWTTLYAMIGLLAASKINGISTERVVMTGEKDALDANDPDFYFDSYPGYDDDADFIAITEDDSSLDYYQISDDEDAAFKELRQKMQDNFQEFRNLLKDLRIADRKNILKFKAKVISMIEVEMYKNISDAMNTWSKFCKEGAISYNYILLGAILYVLGVIVGAGIDRLYRMNRVNVS